MYPQKWLLLLVMKPSEELADVLYFWRDKTGTVALALRNSFLTSRKRVRLAGKVIISPGSTYDWRGLNSQKI
jgi:hypothetical protein